MLLWILDLNFNAWHGMAYSIYALHGSIRSSWVVELFFGAWGGGWTCTVNPELIYPFLNLQGSIDMKHLNIGSCKLIH
jgi:hypothetical protein